MPQYFKHFYRYKFVAIFGINSIVIIAAISGINQELYEAADIDGVGRFGRIAISLCQYLINLIDITCFEA